ncbi:MAG: diguanylate cyclase domain-containing protein, partial [Anaerolineales bacterium]
TTDLQQETLPIQLTSFIDRQAEMEEFRRCFQNSVCRLLTMVGPPGIGKTRLALRVAEDQRHDYPDGVWFVPLDLSQSGENLVANLSKAIGFTLEGASSTYANQLINFLQWKKVLFLLDHFDDFVGESGVLVKLLSRARQVRLLLTSRERLNLQSACLFRLGGLPCIPPEPPFEAQEGDAAQLFIQRARRIRSGFNPDETETAHIVHICHLVEGNPLAIELAAARLRDLSSEQIADRLERGIEVLYTTAQDITERQRSVRASLDYSWERLDFLEKEALSKISIFAGAFTPQEALHKAGVQGATLTTLTNKSLLLKGSGDQFVAPNLIRQYAAEKLAEIYPDFFVTLQKSETQPSLVVPLQTSKINSHNLAAQQLLEDRLSYILKRARRGKSLVAVMVHDINLLDSSSPIQTGEQHEAVLTDIKRQVECTLRQSDSIFSTGTSELTIIIEDLNKHQDALTVAQKIVKDSNSIMVKRHRDVLALINLGISIYPQDGEEPQVLLDKAHLALSHARKYGDCIRFFSDE